MGRWVLVSARRDQGLSEAILVKALQAVSRRDRVLADEVQQDDLAIDRLDVEIDEAVLEVLALQAPVARDLRVVIADDGVGLTGQPEGLGSQIVKTLVENELSGTLEWRAVSGGSEVDVHVTVGPRR